MVFLCRFQRKLLKAPERNLRRVSALLELKAKRAKAALERFLRRELRPHDASAREDDDEETADAKVGAAAQKHLAAPHCALNAVDHHPIDEDVEGAGGRYLEKIALLDARINGVQVDGAAVEPRYGEELSVDGADLEHRERRCAAAWAATEPLDAPRCKARRAAILLRRQRRRFLVPVPTAHLLELTLQLGRRRAARPRSLQVVGQRVELRRYLPRHPLRRDGAPAPRTRRDRHRLPA